MTSPSESVDMVDLEESNQPAAEDIERFGSRSKVRSIIWDHYTEYPNPNDKTVKRYRCNYCPKNYSYKPKTGTTTMLNHFKACTHNPENKSPRLIENYCRARWGVIKGNVSVNSLTSCPFNLLRMKVLGCLCPSLVLFSVSPQGPL
ncbi:hypothetical protein OROMI_027532 [Orobanche minor]